MITKKKIILKISFFLKFKSVIYARVSLGHSDKGLGRSSGFSTGIACSPKHWNSAQHKCVGVGSGEKNKDLLFWKRKIQDAYLQMQAENLPITAENLQHFISYGVVESKDGLLFLYETFLANLGSKVGKSTLYAYQKRCHTLSAWLYQQGCENIRASQLTEDFVTEYESFLKTLGKYDYVRRTLQLLQRVLNWCVKKKMIPENPVSGFELGKKDSNNRLKIDFISLEQLACLENQRFNSPKLAIVRDLFVFQCYTGFAYNELKNFDFKAHTFVHDRLGLCINIQRGKTGIESILPFKTAAYRIIEKYEFKLPILRNDVYNQLLKEVFGICQISKTRITTHLGRKTCAHILFNVDKFDIIEVAKMLGHSNFKTTMSYYTVVHIDRIADRVTEKGIVL